ncbi:hypothetical protein FGKAn22_00260 [Ferrigenium kumadai]|uniref:General secretion pathway GspH domain-containing protein n=1 Tax=Ferrigenium kumadai TaxID=1682490 RepID=A0AAN1SWZ6_9PROT|nr:hypothetical protein FGKAn22_00260 [Ferrigenium kumadai]
MLVCVRNAAGTNCGTGSNWQKGWLVCYAGAAGATSCDAATTDNPNPIRVHQAINSNLTLTGSAALVRFNPNGTQGAGGAATLTLTGTWSGAQAKVAKIAATGLISRP